MAMLKPNLCGSWDWVDLSPGDIIPTIDGSSWIIITKDMIAADGTLNRDKTYTINTLNYLGTKNYPIILNGENKKDCNYTV